MKFFIVILAACLVGAFAELTEEQIAKIKQDREECIAETGVDPAVLEAIKPGEVYEFDDKLNCMASCVLIKSAMMKDDGTLDVEESRKKMLSYLSEEKVDEVLGKCKDQVGKDTCETGGKVAHCFNVNQALPVV